MSKWIGTDLYRALVLTILAGLATVAVALANRDVYNKADIDARFLAERDYSALLHVVEDERHVEVQRQLGLLQDDVRWIVRQMGGTPSVDTTQGSDTP